jgi:Fe-S oxidoreductase
MGEAAVCTHGEVIHAWMRMMMDPDLVQNRLGWLHEGGNGLRVSDDSDTLFFVGCAPYYDVQFRGIGVEGNGVARSTVAVLNGLGIEPQVLAEERCCGHDLLWEGDVEGFAALAELNAELISESGAKRIVTSCPECARALAVDYPAHGIDLGVEILHLSELVASEPWPELEADGGTARQATYHDPCRLGRHLGVYDPPRQALGEAGFELVEMPRTRENGQCCGTNGWTHCGAANKQIQADRLREAQATGADTLVTSCLKCQIHFKCALQDRKLKEEITIEIHDLATLMAQAFADGGANRT